MIDTHVHIVSPDETAYPFSPAYEADWYRKIPVSAEEFAVLMEQTGVEGANLVQAFGPYGTDNRYAVDSANAGIGNFVSTVVVNQSGPQPRKELSGWINRGARGVRLMPFQLGSWPDLIELAVENNLPVQVQFQEKDTQLALKFARDYPDLPFILDHCSFAPFHVGRDFKMAEWFFRLADAAGAHVKVTSIALLACEAVGNTQALLSALVSAFGAERIMWGSDYSQTNSRSYPGFVELARDAMADLSPAEREHIEKGTALRFWPELAFII